MPRRLRIELVGGLDHFTNRGVDQLHRPLPRIRVPLESRQRSDELKRNSALGAGLPTPPLGWTAGPIAPKSHDFGDETARKDSSGGTPIRRVKLRPPFERRLFMAGDSIAKRVESIERQIADLKVQLAQVIAQDSNGKTVKDRVPERYWQDRAVRLSRVQILKPIDSTAAVSADRGQP